MGDQENQDFAPVEDLELLELLAYKDIHIHLALLREMMNLQRTGEHSLFESDNFHFEVEVEVP